MIQMGSRSPVEMLEEGRFLQDFSGLTVYVGQKKDTRLTDVRIYDTRTPGLTREIRAKTGTVRRAQKNDDLLIDLFDVRVDPLSKEQPWPVSAGQYSLKIEDAARQSTYRPKEDDLSIPQLIRYIKNVRALIPQLAGRDAEMVRSTLAVELNKRFVMAISCVSFVLLGVPLGIRAHRKESSVGVAISLLLVFLFYLFIVLAESLRKHPDIRPDLAIWIPVILCTELGIFLTNRQN
jgi:lipopolysaccharide export system permease protein